MLQPASGEILETDHAIIEYDPGYSAENATFAQAIGDTIDQVYPEMFVFFSQIGSMAATPQKVPVRLSNNAALTESQLAAMLSGGDQPLAMTNDDSNFTIMVDPDIITGVSRLKTTIVHELFHHLSYRSGVVNSDSLSPQNMWLIEGTAEVAEYYFNTPNTHKRSRFETYLLASKWHQKVGIKSAAHHAAFLIYYLMQQDHATFGELIRLFAASQDGTSVANTIGLNQYWYDFTKAMFNRPPAQPILIDGSPLLDAVGKNLAPAFGQEGRIYDVPETGITRTEIALPPLSWQHAMLKVDPAVEWFDVLFGDLADEPDFIVHAYIKKNGSDEYIYEDWSGKKSIRICNQPTGPCAGEQMDNVQKIVLIMANSSLQTDLEGNLIAGGFAKKWQLDEMQVNQTLIVPALGKLTLEFDPDGAMLVKSKGWWLKFPPDHFPGSTSAAAYKYINRACRFKGYVKFLRLMPTATVEYQDVQARFKYSWKTVRIEKGGLINTPSGWWCDFRKELLSNAALGNAAGAAATAAVFTRLNTRTYPPGSFAGKLSAIMKAMLSLQVPPSESKDVVMYWIVDGPDANKLQVELQGNVRAFFSVLE